MLTASAQLSFEKILNFCELNKLDVDGVLSLLLSEMESTHTDFRFTSTETPKPNTLYAGQFIRAHSGTYVNVFDPKPEMFLLEDIAEGIAYNYRWGGHSLSKITVAEHSLNVAELMMNEDDVRAALFHDASEAYLSDLPSPIKANIPIYKKIEAKVMAAIAERFGFIWPLSKAVKDGDAAELISEWKGCVLTNTYLSWKPDTAKQLWLNYANSLA